MMNAAIIAAALNAGSAAPPAPFSAPIPIGTSQTASGTLTSDLTTTSDTVAIGDTLLLLTNANNQQPTSVTDSVGHTYTVSNYAPASTRLSFAYVTATVPIPPGTVITVTYGNTNAAVRLNSAFRIAGPAFLDAIGTGATGLSTSPAHTTATMTDGNCLVVSFGLVITGAGDTWTEDTGNGWTAMTGMLFNNAQRPAYKILSGVTAGQPRACTNSVSRTWLMNSIAFRRTA